MSQLKQIRLRLGVTQHALAEAMGCVQGNISFYEKGRSLPAAKAKALINFAATYGLILTFDHVYGDAPLPDEALTASEKAGG